MGTLTLDDALRIGGSTQKLHTELLAHFAASFNAAGDIGAKTATLNIFEDAVIGLRQQQWADVNAVQELYPVDLDPLNPAHAVVLSVRNDLYDTEQKFEALKKSNLLGVQINELKKVAPIGISGAVKYALQNAGVPTGEKDKNGNDPLDKIFKIVVAVGLGVLGLFGAGLFLRARGK